MGTSYQFKCPQCDFEAEVSGEGYAGMMCTTITIHCLDCHDLYDVVDSVMGDNSLFKPKKVRCPEKAKHRWEAWTHPGPCPSCGTTLVKGESTMIWD